MSNKKRDSFCQDDKEYKDWSLFNMKNYHVKVKSIKNITHDVVQIEVEKPQQFNFIPGQENAYFSSMGKKYFLERW